MNPPTYGVGVLAVLTAFLGLPPLVPSAGSPRQTADRLALEPCGPAGAEGQMLCGRLDVPENYDHPERRTISLKVVVVPAANGTHGAAALFDLAGGPGLAATDNAGSFLGPKRGFRETRDVVLVDQRGTGGSHPLRCPEIESRSPFEEMYPVDAVTACRQRLAATADLTHYTTENSARDLDRVRAALGYTRIDLGGVSYGTELARAYMRLFPERVGRAVLIGPPALDMRTPLPHAANAQRALDLLFHECQSDERCRSAYPGLRAKWTGVLRRVEAGVRLPRLDPMTGAVTEVAITNGPFAEAFRGLFTTATRRRSIPFLVGRAADGDFSPFVDAVPPAASGLAEGLYLSIACAEGTAGIDPADVAGFTSGTFLGDYRVRQQMRACTEWPVAPAAPELRAPLVTAHPVLVLVGEFDATTPPQYAREVCAALENCRLVEIPAMGHVPFDLGEWRNGACFDRLVQAFLDGAAPANLDASCVAAMAPPAFRLDDAVTLATGAMKAVTGTYAQGPIRLVVDVLQGRLRARLFNGDDAVGASFLTPVSPTRFRLDQIPGQFLRLNDEGGRRTLRLSNGQVFVRR